jgi:hypothetical protein
MRDISGLVIGKMQFAIGNTHYLAGITSAKGEEGKQDEG